MKTKNIHHADQFEFGFSRRMNQTAELDAFNRDLSEAIENYPERRAQGIFDVFHDHGYSNEDTQAATFAILRILNPGL